MAAILPRMLWASPVSWLGNPGTLNPLTVAYNRCVRWITGLPSSTDSVKLLICAHLPPLHRYLIIYHDMQFKTYFCQQPTSSTTVYQCPQEKIPCQEFDELRLLPMERHSTSWKTDRKQSMVQSKWQSTGYTLANLINLTRSIVSRFLLCQKE
jgi:hypothetical protein